MSKSFDKLKREIDAEALKLARFLRAHFFACRRVKGYLRHGGEERANMIGQVYAQERGWA